jgi:hypothetical protein
MEVITMTGFEILLACIENMHTAFVALFVISCVIFTGCFVCACAIADDSSTCDTDKEEGYKVCRKISKYNIPLFLIMLFAMCLPNVDDLWKVRIGLLKLELVNKTNIEAGAAVIERIGKKLECKYIGGCPDDSKEVKK